jgi:hypothetical protein
MTPLYALALAASALLLAIAYRMEASAIRQRINGANGLTLLAAFITSATATIPLAAIAWWVNGAMTAAATLLVSALWHLAAWRLTLRRLHDLIALTTGDSTKATP